MKERIQNPPVLVIVLLVILTTILLIVKTGSELLNREKLENYLNNNNLLLNDETLNNFNEYLKDNNISIEVSNYIKNSSYIKEEINKIVLETYDHCVSNKELNITAYNLIKLVKLEVNKYENDSNEEVWPKIGPQIEQSITEGYEVYKSNILPTIGVIFKLFSDISWKIIILVIFIIMSIMFIFKKTWALFYTSGALFIGFLFNIYLIKYTKNLYNIGSIIIPDKIFDGVKRKALENNNLIMYLSIIIMSIFLIIQVILLIRRRIALKKEIAKL